MVHVYTGSGKGKTTASIGLAIRALGHKKKVCLLQFLKGPASGEITILNKFKNVKVYCFGRRGFCKKNNLKEEDFVLAKAGFKKAKALLDSFKPDLLILDELNLVLHFGLLNKDEVLGFIKSIPKKTELVVTGRYAPQELIECADLVSDIQEVKHYFNQGIAKRRAIEY